jgi:hypothetical protein
MTHTKLLILVYVLSIIFLGFFFEPKEPKPSLQTPAKSTTTSVKRQLKADKFIIYENGCFDAKFTDGGAGGKYILRCI